MGLRSLSKKYIFRVCIIYLKLLKKIQLFINQKILFNINFDGVYIGERDRSVVFPLAHSGQNQFELELGKLPAIIRLVM